MAEATPQAATAARLERLRRRMAEENLEGLLVGSPANRRYLSGFTGSSGWLLITADRAELWTDFRYLEQAAAQAPGFEIVRHEPDVYRHLGRRIQELGLGRLGFERDHLTYAQWERLRGALPEKVEMVAVGGWIEELRRIKDPAEIAAIRQAARIADEALLEVLADLRPGVTEREVALQLEFAMRRRGAEGVSFDLIVASGPRSALPHGTASDRVIEAGDFVTIDYGALYGGYASDCTRTVVVGPAGERQRRIYDIVLEAQRRALAAVRPGATGAEVDRAARAVIEEAGYGDHFGHATGHGVGLEVHEGPRLAANGRDDVLAPGMVVTVEPGIYLPGWGGVRIEDLVVVTENGGEILTRVTKEFLQLAVS
ncbi:MAG: Xaa-Pro dipeptidase [Bacillota bacterium]|nr:MAG: Xaa-Pro dipeptidase [Bacillota bacterium]